MFFSGATVSQGGERELMYAAPSSLMACPDGLFMPTVGKGDVFAALVVHCGAGSEDDPDERGLAHLAEHAVFAAFKHHSKGGSHGDIVCNAYTTVDRVVFFCHGLASNSPAVLEYVQHCASALNSSPDAALPRMVGEVPAVLMEMQQRQPPPEAHRLLWGEGHPLGRRVLGDPPLERTLPAAAWKGGASFWTKIAAARRQAVCVGPEDLCRAVRGVVVSAAQKGSAGAAVHTWAPPPPGHVGNVDPNGGDVQVRFLWRCTSRKSGNCMFAIASRMLRQSLNQSLRFGNTGKVYSVMTDSYPSGVENHYVVVVGTQCRPEDAESVVGAILETGTNLDKGWSEQEFDQARDAADYSFMLRARNAKDVGDMLCTASSSASTEPSERLTSLREVARWVSCGGGRDEFQSKWRASCRLIRRAVSVQG